MMRVALGARVLLSQSDDLVPQRALQANRCTITPSPFTSVLNAGRSSSRVSCCFNVAAVFSSRSPSRLPSPRADRALRLHQTCGQPGVGLHTLDGWSQIDDQGKNRSVYRRGERAMNSLFSEIDMHQGLGRAIAHIGQPRFW